MLLLYFWRGGGGSFVFMQPVAPLFYICFITFFVQSRNSVIFVFSFLVVNLIVSVSSGFFPLCIDDKGGERAVIAVCVSSFHFNFFF